MDKKSIDISPFMGEKEKWYMWLGKLMERSEINGYDVLLRDYIKTQTDKGDKTKHKGDTAKLNIFEKKVWNGLIVY